MLNEAYTSFLTDIMGETYKPHKTGIIFIDDVLDGGVLDQTTTIILAAPGTGKTALAQQWAEKMAEGGTPMLYLNLEMSREQMLARAISFRLAEQGKRYSMKKILQGYALTEKEQDEIAKAVSWHYVNVAPYLTYNPPIGTDVDDIIGHINSLGASAKAENRKAPGVILDYLHCVTSRNPMDEKELLKKIMYGLKSYANNYNTFAIIISATNRISNQSGQITGFSARDSSNVEYAADVTLSLNFWDLDNGNKSATKNEDMEELLTTTPRQMVLRCHKNRTGKPGGKQLLYYNAECNYYYDKRTIVPNSALFEKTYFSQTTAKTNAPEKIKKK